MSGINFLRKMVGAVIVGAVGGEHRQAIGVVIGPGQVVAGGFGRRIGAVRLIAVGLAEGRVGRPQRTINLIGGDLQEAKRALLAVRQSEAQY
jgi:hypothetical protein